MLIFTALHSAADARYFTRFRFALRRRELRGLGAKISQTVEATVKSSSRLRARVWEWSELFSGRRCVMQALIASILNSQLEAAASKFDNTVLDLGGARVDCGARFVDPVAGIVKQNDTAQIRGKIELHTLGLNMKQRSRPRRPINMPSSRMTLSRTFAFVPAFRIRDLPEPSRRLQSRSWRVTLQATQYSFEMPRIRRPSKWSARVFYRVGHGVLLRAEVA